MDMSNQTHNSLWEQYERSASFARKQGNFTKAARILREAFREAEEYAELAPTLVDAAHDLAELYINQYRYVEAEGLYRSVLELREKLLGQTHDDVVESLKNVAIVQILAFRSEALGHTLVNSPSTWNHSSSTAAAS